MDAEGHAASCEREREVHTEFAAPDGQAGFYRASLLNCSLQSSRGYKGGSRRSFAGEAQSAGKNNMLEAVASLPARQDLLEIWEFRLGSVSFFSPAG